MLECIIKLVARFPCDVNEAQSTTTFGDLPPGESATAGTPVLIRVSAAAPSPYRPQLDVGFKADWAFRARGSLSLDVVALGLAEDMEAGGADWTHAPVKWTADDWSLSSQYAAGGTGQAWKCGPPTACIWVSAPANCRAAATSTIQSWRA